MPKVTLARTDNRATGIDRAIGLLDDAAAAFAGKSVALKPNFNSDDTYPGSTHNDTLRALVAWLREAGAKEITIADRSGGSWETHEVFEKKGIHELARELGVRAVETDSLSADDWEVVDLPNSHWSHGVEAPKLFTRAEAVLETCCLKTHAFGGHFTLSLKNVVGVIAKTSPRDGYAYMREMHGSPHMREMIAEANLAYTPNLVVMDGLKAFVKGGPATGTLVSPGVILASTDRVAIDAVGVAILRLYKTTPEVAKGPIFELTQIRRAAELGLGARSIEEIELVADDDPQSRAFVERVRAVIGGSLSSLS